MTIDTALFDIDGVLTDGMVYVNSKGDETKKISFDDIDAIFSLKRAGIKIGFVTGEANSFSEYVKERFSPDFFQSGCKDKLSFYKELERNENLDSSKTCFVGDSRKDEGLLKHLFYSFAPSDADAGIKRSARFVTSAARGNGVIKEVADFIFNKNLGGGGGEDDAYRFWRDGIRDHLKVVSDIEDDEAFLSVVDEVAEVIAKTYRSGGRLLLCGNGGSAADSQHIETELVSRFLMQRKALDAEALTVNTSTLSAIGNDYGFDAVFSRQVEAKGKRGDVLLAISTSGNSENIVKAIEAAKKMGMVTVGLTGGNRETMVSRKSDYCICVPSLSTPRIQEVHILVGHMLCEYIEKKIAGC